MPHNHQVRRAKPCIQILHMVMSLLNTRFQLAHLLEPLHEGLVDLVERQVQLDVLEISELLLGIEKDLGFGAHD
jgi:hypothetical protein